VAASEARTRLQQFGGATSISSNQYFGREEEEDTFSGDGMGYSDLETSARDFAKRFMNTSGDDIERIKDGLSAGAQKLSEYIQKYAG